jgi:hypothetical protein
MTPNALDTHNANEPKKKLVQGLVQHVLRSLDSVINWRNISIFENIIYQIISENRISHYDSTESYYSKLESLKELRQNNWDTNNIDLLTNGWMLYTVDWYTDIVFTRWELERLWSDYTEKKVYWNS